MTGLPLLGLDLHGTLLGADERFPEACTDELATLLRRLSDRLIAVACTGNDLSFVRSVLPPPVLDALQGFVLETGCSFAADVDGPETLVVPPETARRRDDLEELLRRRSWPQVTRLGHRLASVSLFTPAPRSFLATVAAAVADEGFADVFDVTYSSVAVDVVPRGFDKLRGLRAAARGAPAWGVADSVNDLPLLAGADLAFAPSNLAPEAAEALALGGRPVLELTSAAALVGGVVLRAPSRETRGVIDVLHFIEAHIG